MISSSDPRVHAAEILRSTTPGPAAGYDEWVNVEVHADPGLDVVALVVAGAQQLRWHQDISRVRQALAAATGVPQWCAKHSMLLVPGGFHSPARSSFFCLAATPRGQQGTDSLPAPDMMLCA